MIVVTFATLLYLRKTLTSQLHVQKLQLKATMIENSRFLADQDLRFDLQLVDSSFHSLGENKIIHIFIIGSTLKNGNCKNFQLKITAENTEISIDGGGIYTRSKDYQEFNGEN